MKRSTRMILGVSVALLTAAGLHFTVGNRFHEKAYFGRYGYEGCGHDWNRHSEKPPLNQPLE
jgi:hypothetical protein